MSEINTTVNWEDEKNTSTKDVITQAPQQIFLLTVAYPQATQADGQVIKNISSFSQSIPGQQHILLQPVNGVIPVTPVEKSKNSIDCVSLNEKNANYTPLVVLNAPVNQNSCAESIAAVESTEYILPNDLIEPLNHELMPRAPAPLNQFELNENTPVISFEETVLPSFTSTDKELSSLQVTESEVEEIKHIISDGPLIPRAKLTLPTEYLVFKNVHSMKDVIGVFARKDIPERAQFGPMKGVRVATNRIDMSCPGLCLTIYKQDGTKQTLSVKNEETSNWMRYVRVAFKAQEQNLALNQIEEELYFTTTRAIKQGQELRIWYSYKYAFKRDLPLLTKGKEKWRCCKCPFVSLKSKPMNHHLTQHRNGKIEDAKGFDVHTSERNEDYISSNDVESSKSDRCKMCETGFCTVHATFNKFTQDSTDNEASPVSSSLEDDGEDIFRKGVVCNICGRVFVSSIALSLHYKSHSDKILYECPLCQRTFDKVLEMKSHIATHRENGVFRCTVCNKEFPTYRQVRKHIKLGHSKHVHNCSVCMKTFASADRLRNHMLSHSSDKQFLCANCGKQFKRKDKLVAHMRSVHTRSVLAVKERPAKDPPVNPDFIFLSFKCFECQVGFKKRGVLVNHILSRHPGTKLDSVPDLKQPILKQTKDYLCQYCDKIYKSSTKRKAHILKIHPGAKLPSSSQDLGENSFTQTVGSVSAAPQSCEWCKKQYASKPKLIQHQRKAHLNLMPKSLRLPSITSSRTLSQRAKKTDSSTDCLQEGNKVSEVKPSELDQRTQNNGTELNENEGIFLADGGIIVDGLTLKKVLKIGDSAMECVLDSGFKHLLTESRSDQYFKILTQGGVTIAQPVELWDPLSLSPALPNGQTSPSIQGTSQLNSHIIIPR